MLACFSGEGGIRTLEAGTSPPTRFPVALLKPLGHLSETGLSLDDRLEPEPAYAALAPPEVVGDLVPQCALDLGPQKFRIAPEVALDRVLVEDDPVLAIPVHDRAAVVVPVRAELGSVVGDHDRHRPEDVLELLRQAVDRVSNQLVELRGRTVRRRA